MGLGQARRRITSRVPLHRPWRGHGRDRQWARGPDRLCGWVAPGWWLL